MNQPIELTPPIVDVSGVAPKAERPKLTAREQRWERRRRRRLFEEVAGWILVPAILVVLYMGISAGMDSVGLTLSDIVQGAKVLGSIALP